MDINRIRIEIEGIVQGVGFRPFIFRLAGMHAINGWVLNNSGGVIIEAEGELASVSAFLRDITAEAPPLAAITSVRSEKIAAQGDRGFVIRPSAVGSALVLFELNVW